MGEKAGAMSEALPTFQTLVGLYPSVALLVADQAGALAEVLPTFQALLGFLIGVRLLHSVRLLHQLRVLAGISGSLPGTMEVFPPRGSLSCVCSPSL